MSNRPAAAQPRSGMTIIDVMMGVVAVVLLTILVLTTLHHARQITASSMCARNLGWISSGMAIYSASNKKQFPAAGRSSTDGFTVGFREGNRRTGRGAILQDNVTASLWMLVRDAFQRPESFTCERTMDEPDPLTISRDDSTPADLANTYDFLERTNLSYSMINLHHQSAGNAWTDDAPADWVLMGDNNCAEGEGVHTSSTGSKWDERIARLENSLNHAHEGQTLLFGDLHVDFAQDPFQGPNGDNVYAMIGGGRNGPPQLGNAAGDAATDPQIAAYDVVLLPLSGNGGGAGSLSGLPADVKMRFAGRWYFLGPCVALPGLLLLLAVALLRKIQPIRTDRDSLYATKEIWR